MKKILVLSTLMFLLNGCVESVAFLGSTAGGASSGRVLQSSLNSAISYGIKKQTGKTPLGHALAYAEEKNPQKKKEPCISFVEKTRSEFCTVLKKQIALTNIAIKEKALLIVAKTPKIENIVIVERDSKLKTIVIEEDKNLIQTKKSPRELAISFQAELKKLQEKYKNYLVSR